MVLLWWRGVAAEMAWHCRALSLIDEQEGA